MLNIRRGSPDGRYTLVIQLIRERRRGVIFTPYRLLPGEFDRQRGKAAPTSRSKAHMAFIREVNIFLEKQKEEIQRVLTELQHEGKPFSVRDVTQAYHQRYDNRYVHTFFTRQIEELRKEGAQGTANKYNATLVAFENSSETAVSISTTWTRICCSISNSTSGRFPCNPIRSLST